MTTAYLFPGQGSQYVGMGKEAFDTSEAARALFDEADELFGFKLSEIAFNGPQEKLTDTIFQQPALFVASLANWQVMSGNGWPEPDFFAGHSLGEFSALVAAGSLSFSDGLRLVRRRGELMKEADERAPGAMAAILALSADQVEELCTRAEAETDQLVCIANDNCPGQIVISGHEDALARAEELAREAGARRVVRLPITIAAHTMLMDSVSAEFAEAIDSVQLHAPRKPVISNVSALPLESVEEIRHELRSQLISPVAWTKSIQYLLDQGADEFVEVGPNDVLLSLVKRINRKTTRTAFDKGPDK